MSSDTTVLIIMDGLFCSEMRHDFNGSFFMLATSKQISHNIKQFSNRCFKVYKTDNPDVFGQMKKLIGKYPSLTHTHVYLYTEIYEQYLSDVEISGTLTGDMIHKHHYIEG